MFRLFYFMCFLITSINLCANSQFFFNREDGSQINGYLDTPDDGDFPLIIFLAGSWDSTVKTNHTALSKRFLPSQIGIISLEKRGVTEENFDKIEFYKYDCFEERYKDYLLLLRFIKEKKIARHNGCYILMGGSEGGLIVPKLAANFPELVTGSIIIGSGGGLSFAEGMKYQSKQIIAQKSFLQRSSYKIRGGLLPNAHDKHYNKMLKKSDSLKMCGPKTWKWWASYLRYNPLEDLLKIETPIYLIHGEKDDMVPIESADLIYSAFKESKKTNLRYERYSDLGHSLRDRDDVYCDLVKWIKTLTPLENPLN